MSCLKLHSVNFYQTNIVLYCTVPLYLPNNDMAQKHFAYAHNIRYVMLYTKIRNMLP